MREENVRCRMFGEIGVNRRAVHGVAAWRISAIGPINEPILQIELEIDWFRQTVEQKFDISAVRSDRTLRDVDLHAEDSPCSRIGGSSLSLLILLATSIEREPT